jgi:hypothetical protein
MKDPSERARLVLERYKAATTPPAADKARLLEVVQQRSLRGDLPRFHIQTSTPVVPQPSLLQQIWGSALGKVGLAVTLTGLSALGVQQNHGGRAIATVHSSSPAVTAAPHADLTAVPSAAIDIATTPLQGSAPPVASAMPHPKADKALDSAASAGSAEPTIDDEIKLMNGAQAALRSGDPKRALQLLAEHARRFPNGRLASARAVSHMIALCALGRSDDARLEAERFLAKNPNSAFAERARNVCSPARESP